MSCADDTQPMPRPVLQREPTREERLERLLRKCVPWVEAARRAYVTSFTLDIADRGEVLLAEVREELES